MRRTPPVRLASLLLLLGSLLLPAVPAVASTPADKPRVRLATTTSTEAAGLLDFLVPHFEADMGYGVDVVAVGTGAALKLGENGDVDIVLVHARDFEDDFMAAGHGGERRDVMVNDFVILGPPKDPAAVRSLTSAVAVLQRIAEERTPFVSRGDRSGTHVKERAIWAVAGLSPIGRGREEAWYRDAGQGMAEVIFMASRMGAYTLADRGTWLALRKKTELVVLHEGDPTLENPYGVITVNPERHARLNHEGARALLEWLTSPRGQTLIGGFKEGGESLFRPAARPSNGGAE